MKIDPSIIKDECLKKRGCECCSSTVKATYLMQVEKTGIIQLIHLCEPCEKETKLLNWGDSNVTTYKK